MSSRSISIRSAVACTGALAPAMAWAHSGVGSASGLAHGFGHPITGLDHVLAMVAVGVFAANLGGRAFWAVPFAFVGVMAIGGALGISGIGIPFVETGIAMSVVVLGVAIGLRWKWPVAGAMALVGLFAVFHGHAHGSEMPVDASGLEYAIGFILATGLLHTAGIGIGVALARTGHRYSPPIVQTSGAAMALAGVAMLAGIA